MDAYLDAAPDGVKKHRLADLIGERVPRAALWKFTHACGSAESISAMLRYV